MTDKQRIEQLEKEVQELKQKIEVKKTTTDWHYMSSYIDKRLDEIMDEPYTRYQVKSSITNLLGKSFRKKTVMKMKKEELEEAKPFVDTIIKFVKDTREKYDNNLKE